MDDLAADEPGLEEAPPVVAVMVVRDPGPWFEDALSALAGQDYPALSILVVDAASAEDPTDRVAAAVPSAFVRRLHADPGYAAAANEVLKVVKGASHLLFVHDDVAPEPDAVRMLLEACYRGNAGIATPKLVEWDDPAVLMAVGESADPLGRHVPLVEPGELDQGQHDGEREVLVGPGACLLVRFDLFERLRGFDKAINLGGEDVDLCWRAAVAGARTLTAPAARVRHRGALSAGERTSPLGNLEQLALQHRLRAALIAAPSYRFPLTLAIAMFTAVVEAAVALAVGKRASARVALATLGANLRSFGSLLAARRRLAGLRKDGNPAAVRRLLARRGRLKALVRAAAGDDAESQTAAQLVRDGLGGFWARGLRRHVVAMALLGFVLLVGSRHLLGGPMPQLGSLASLPQDSRELLRAYLSGARPAGMGGVGAAPAAFPLLGLASLMFFGETGLVGTVLVLGSLAAGVVGAGRLARPVGSGRATAAAAIAYAAVPLWPDALAQGRLAGLVAYAAAPWLLLRLAHATGLPPFGADAPAEDGGAEDGGLAEAARRARRRAEVRRPVAALVGRGSGGEDEGLAFEPFSSGELEGFDELGMTGRGRDSTSGEALSEVGGQHALDEMGAFDDDVELDDLARSRVRHRGVAAHRLSPPPAPVRSRLQQATGIAVLLALGTALAPSLLPAAAVATLGLTSGVLVAGEAAALFRAARTAALGAVGAIILLSPWSAELLRAHQWSALTGAAGPASAAPRAIDLFRFSTGPLSAGFLPLLLLVAAALPLAIGRSWRTAWAARSWAVVVVTFAVAFLSGRGWLGLTPLEPGVLLPFAAAAVALAIALGAASFEVDLRGHSFGWRQLASLASAGLVALACVPMLIAVHTGRWGAPERSQADILSWMPDLVAEGPFRVLWVGDPTALPLTGWHLDDGLAFATSRNGPPTAADQWAGPKHAVDDQLAGPVRGARRNGLVDLGHRLAPLGVRFIVVPLRAAPVGAPERPVPADLPAALRAQVDLRQIDTNPSLLVFENAAWAPARSQLPADVVGAARKGGSAATLDLSQAKAVLAPGRRGKLAFSGPIEEGEILLAEAPSRRWQLDIAGRSAPRHRAFGVNAFTVAGPGPGKLTFRTPPLHLVAVLVQAGLWVLALAVLAGRGLRRARTQPIRPTRAAAQELASQEPDERSSVVLLEPVGTSGAPPRPARDTPRPLRVTKAEADPIRIESRGGRSAIPAGEKTAGVNEASSQTEPEIHGLERAAPEPLGGEAATERRAGTPSGRLGGEGGRDPGLTAPRQGGPAGPAAAEAVRFLESLRTGSLDIESDAVDLRTSDVDAGDAARDETSDDASALDRRDGGDR